MRTLLPALTALLTPQCLASSLLIPRSTAQHTCTDLHATSNNGNRKIALVIDSSGSMAESDPSDLRLSVGRSVASWLIPKFKATSSKPADLLAVIDFSDVATLDYPLGDPGGANASFDEIGALGGTSIASGVSMAITQLTGSGTGATGKRSGIVVFTDGEVSWSFLKLCFQKKI